MRPYKPESARSSAWARYLVAVGCVVLGWLARTALTPAVGPTALPFIFFFPAVALASWYGRLRPGLLAMVLSGAAANWFFINPVHSWTIGNLGDAVALAAFAASCLFIVWALEAMHRARANEARQNILTALTLASIGDAVIATNEKGNVTFLNAEAERLTGWKNAEALGQPLMSVFRIINEKTRQPAENPVEKVLRTGTVVGLANHTVLVSKDGRETAIDDSAAPIREGEEPVAGVVLVFRDVTEQRKAQEAATRLAAIVEHSGDAIFTKDINGIVQTWNASAEKLFGYQAEEIVGKPVTTLFPPDRLNEEDGILGRLRKGQPVERFETVRVAKNGRRIPVAVSVSPLKNEDGEVVGASKVVHDITDLAAAREALMREKELLATTLASIGDAVIVTDAEGRITFLNAEAQRLTKWSDAEAVGQPLPNVFRILNEYTRQPVENPVEKVLRLGGIVGLANHTVLIAKDGTELPIDDSAAPIREPGGPLFGVVLVFRDFTARKQGEQALRDSEAFLKSVIESSPDCIKVLDLETRLISLNQSGKILLELDDVSPHLNKSWLEFWKGPERKQAEAAVARATAGGLGGFQAFLPTFKGTPRWWDIIVNPRFDADGRINGFLAVSRDITARKEAEEKLRGSQEQLSRQFAELEAIYQTAPLGLCLLDRELRFRRVNKRLAEINGVPADEHIGRTVREVVPSLTAQAEEALRHVLETGEATTFEFRGETPAQPGIERIWDEHWYPLRDTANNIHGIGIVAEEITQRRKMEHALREAQRKLLLHSAQLEAALEQAQSASRAKDQFLANLSHELRTPLTPAVLQISLLKRTEDLPPAVRRSLNIIERNLKLESKMVNDLLDLSRIVNNKLELNPVRCDLHEIIENALEVCLDDSNTKRLEVVKQLDASRREVCVDATRLQQVLWNLIQNAFKFTPAGGKITLRSRNVDGEIFVDVADTGCGLEAPLLARIFEPFEQGQTDRKEALRGLGLGLAIAKRIVTAHGGNLSAASDGKDRGATFTLSLKVVEATTEPGASHEENWK